MGDENWREEKTRERKKREMWDGVSSEPLKIFSRASSTLSSPASQGFTNWCMRELFLSIDDVAVVLIWRF